MKGVVLSLAPHVQIVDITHDIPPQDIAAATFALETAIPHFPPGCIHVAIVDPGVGTDRAGLIIETAHGLLVGPDNGIFTTLIPWEGQFRAFRLDQPRFWRPEVSRTFHGRDIFAPVAGHLARGVAPAEMGSPVTQIVRLTWPLPEYGASEVRGSVIHVDRFGNLITNLRPQDLPGLTHLTEFIVRETSTVGLQTHYQAGNGLLALVGSSGRIELAVPGGNAARTLGVGVGTTVRVRSTADAKPPKQAHEAERQGGTL